MKCKKCGKENHSDAKFCYSCGFDLSKKICPHCGAIVWHGLTYCSNCYRRFDGLNNSKQWKQMESTVFGSNVGTSSPLNTPYYDKTEGTRITPSVTQKKQTSSSVSTTSSNDSNFWNWVLGIFVIIGILSIIGII